MSLRTPQGHFPRQAREAYFTPPSGVTPLLAYADRVGLWPPLAAVWEPAAGAGHIARILAARGCRVLATDLAPPVAQVDPVAPLDFLSSSGPSGPRLEIVTNPPYGFQNRLALAFLRHALQLMESRLGSIALLLPFEFDARASRNGLVGEHPWFLAKVTCATRLRWLNLPQSDNAPMGHHSWFIWCNDMKVHRRALNAPRLVVL